MHMSLSSFALIDDSYSSVIVVTVAATYSFITVIVLFSKIQQVISLKPPNTNYIYWQLYLSRQDVFQFIDGSLSYPSSYMAIIDGSLSYPSSHLAIIDGSSL